MAEKFDPDRHVAIISTTGSVYKPVWIGEDGLIRGTMIHAASERLLAAGGNYLIGRCQIADALTAGEFEVWDLCRKYGREFPRR